MLLCVLKAVQIADLYSFAENSGRFNMRVSYRVYRVELGNNENLPAFI